MLWGGGGCDPCCSNTLGPTRIYRAARKQGHIVLLWECCVCVRAPVTGLSRLVERVYCSRVVVLNPPVGVGRLVTVFRTPAASSGLCVMVV